MKKSEDSWNRLRKYDRIEFSIPACDGRENDMPMIKIILESLEIEYHYSYARSIVYPNYHEFVIPAKHENFDILKRQMRVLFENHPMNDSIVFRLYNAKGVA